jgi:membrane protease YdiL (CAAX protease family)
MSALIFGVIHYFGMPGKIPGMLMAGFMGWLLTFAIIQTSGIFWAWSIHFAQDVIILTIALAAEKSKSHK